MRSVPLKGAGSLEDGIESPTSDPVDEQTDQDALVKECGSGLHACARKEEKSEDVMVYS